MRNGKKSLVLPAMMAMLLALLLVAGPNSSAAQFTLPGVIAPSACRVGAVLSTDQFTTTGFSNVRTARPGEEVVAGAWVIADNFVPDTSVILSPNCVAAGTTVDGFGLNVMGVRIKPTIVSAQDADIREIKLVLDQNLNGQWDPLLDIVLQTKPGSELDSPDGAVFWNGPQSPLFTLFDNQVACPNAGAIILGAECARGLLAVVVIGDSPKTGVQFGLELEALAGDVPNAPFGTTITPISSGFSSSRNPQASNVRLQMIGGTPGSGTPLQNISNGSGNPESAVREIKFTGGQAGEGLLTRFRAQSIKPGEREVVVMAVGVCDAAELANTTAAILPAIAGAPPTIAGGLASLPCIVSAASDGFATGINGATLIFSGPLARYIQTVRLYADIDCDGVLFEGATIYGGELFAQATPVYNEDTGEAIVQFGGRQEQILTNNAGTPLAAGCDIGVAPPIAGTDGLAAAAPAPLILIFTADIDSSAPGGTVDVRLGLQSFDDTAQFLAGFANPCGFFGVGAVCGSNFFNIGPETYSFTVEGPAARPIGVSQFDTDGSCFLEDPEFFASIQQWVGGQVDDPLFFDAVNAWVNQTNVCIAAAGLSAQRSVTLSQTSQSLTLSVSSQGVTGVGLTVYDLNGRTVFAQETAGTTLSWNYLSSEGRPVANGVYLYVVTIKGTDGQVLQSEVRKLVVLR